MSSKTQFSSSVGIRDLPTRVICKILINLDHKTLHLLAKIKASDGFSLREECDLILVYKKCLAFEKSLENKRIKGLAPTIGVSLYNKVYNLETQILKLVEIENCEDDGSTLRDESDDENQVRKRVSAIEAMFLSQLGDVDENIESISQEVSKENSNEKLVVQIGNPSNNVLKSNDMNSTSDSLNASQKLNFMQTKTSFNMISDHEQNNLPSSFALKNEEQFLLDAPVVLEPIIIEASAIVEQFTLTSQETVEQLKIDAPANAENQKLAEINEKNSECKNDSFSVLSDSSFNEKYISSTPTEKRQEQINADDLVLKFDEVIKLFDEKHLLEPISQNFVKENRVVQLKVFNSSISEKIKFFETQIQIQSETLSPKISNKISE
ncbi:hypothetical protein QEN19_001988 [Hanseniaspora menglaensis]